MNPIVSIIVPHYNSLEELLHLVKSIGEDERAEILIIDDKSDADCFDKLQVSLKKQGNVRVFQNDSLDKKGAGVARNIGLDVAKGEWLLFADSDDYFTHHFLDVIENYTSEKSDVIYFPPTSIDVATGDKSDRHEIYVKRLDNYIANPTREAELFLRANFDVVWSKMVRSSLVREHQIQFDETMVANDVMFSVKTGILAKSIQVVEETIYVTTRNSTSLTTDTSRERYLIRYHVNERKYLFLKEQLGDEVEVLRRNLGFWMIVALRNEYGKLWLTKLLLSSVIKGVPINQKYMWPDEKNRIKQEWFAKEHEKFLF